MDGTSDFQQVRLGAAAAANAEDAALWRWFSELFEDQRIRWCRAEIGWRVTVDHRHVATELTFDAGIRAAKAKNRCVASAAQAQSKERSS
ncbi:hypothetical protein A6V36_34080 [Paraburkholderia ginsengiterrae]|uniref:Uncharacterized protein n=1 Tax=Paraburkholderia ginsengiterrae TaxID=1462993 RepID=A0A1A9NA58_9BURK|nr:hypothetical protein A6V36_34080 [Paraburkholderia ginsengiterrae]OAJ61582.1 hypothetical protein A6V37_24850 [Paraburkholderia ginsengiterrae]